MRVGTDGGDLNQTLDPGRRRRLGHGLRAPDVYPGEGLLATLVEDSDQVDRRVGALHRGLDGDRILNRRAQGRDLPDLAQGLEEVRPRGTAHRDPDDPALLGQAPDQVTADEPGSAEDRNHALGHGFAFSPLGARALSGLASR